MAVIDRANSFYLKDLAQAASNVLDFGAADKGGHGNFGGYLNVVATKAGSVKLQDSADGTTFADVAGSTITLGAAGAATIVLPPHRRFVKAVLTTLTSSDCDVYIGAPIGEI